MDGLIKRKKEWMEGVVGRKGKVKMWQWVEDVWRELGKEEVEEEGEVQECSGDESNPACVCYP